ncbi:hypothetical protein CJO91_11455 [Ralstonia solanacearum]|nr:hypothetical protein CJO83_08105 [Ralstonia solanacearum]AXW33319.1 hypothetical protein CJO88_08145 [Ralstonia solanacearum]AXW43016.1 hypothetical protein CJO90_08100 [Ralstonia solanacearum]AXW48252.1 hypothetical protein CJO91_11455 [Ralstonia solanacearum]AXW66339.1 hypothetical protein CJO95_08105 [Ralstonia solanacearum]
MLTIMCTGDFVRLLSVADRAQAQLSPDHTPRETRRWGNVHGHTVDGDLGVSYAYLSARRHVLHATGHNTSYLFVPMFISVARL